LAQWVNPSTRRHGSGTSVWWVRHGALLWTRGGKQKQEASVSHPVLLTLEMKSFQAWP
jgi:hypothetical protein